MKKQDSEIWLRDLSETLEGEAVFQEGQKTVRWLDLGVMSRFWRFEDNS